LHSGEPPGTLPTAWNAGFVDIEWATEDFTLRAGLMGALGKYSRASVTKPLVYATEMVAFFERFGEIEATQITPSGGHGDSLSCIHNAYWKKTFGIVHLRTDGERVLVATHSGKDDQKESDAFHVDGQGGITFEKETRII
jgi:hypothetical protein